MTTLLVVLSGLCLLAVWAWPDDISVLAPVGSAAVVAACLLTAPVGVVAVVIALGGSVVSAFGLATFFQLIHPVESRPHSAATHPG